LNVHSPDPAQDPVAKLTASIELRQAALSLIGDEAGVASMRGRLERAGAEFLSAATTRIDDVVVATASGRMSGDDRARKAGIDRSGSPDVGAVRRSDVVLLCLPDVETAADRSLDRTNAMCDAISPFLGAGQLLVTIGNLVPGTTELILKPRLVSENYGGAEGCHFAYWSAAGMNGSGAAFPAIVPQVFGGDCIVAGELMARFLASMRLLALPAGSPTAAEAVAMADRLMRKVNSAWLAGIACSLQGSAPAARPPAGTRDEAACEASKPTAFVKKPKHSPPSAVPAAGCGSVTDTRREDEEGDIACYS
jgi:hypothetical protein